MIINLTTYSIKYNNISHTIIMVNFWRRKGTGEETFFWGVKVVFVKGPDSLIQNKV